MFIQVLHQDLLVEFSGNKKSDYVALELLLTCKIIRSMSVNIKVFVCI